MAKILEINPATIVIGMDNGSIKEVPSDSVNFVPHVGDQVEIFETTSRVIVSKAEPIRSMPVQPQYQQPQPTPNIIINNANHNVNTNINRGGYGRGKPKNKWVALLLCFFFGFLGVHKFYEGKVGMGILYILTVGFFGIGLVIDFLVLLFKPNPYYV